MYFWGFENCSRYKKASESQRPDQYFFGCLMHYMLEKFKKLHSSIRKPLRLQQIELEPKTLVGVLILNPSKIKRTQVWSRKRWTIYVVRQSISKQNYSRMFFTRPLEMIAVYIICIPNFHQESFLHDYIDPEENNM